MERLNDTIEVTQDVIDYDQLILDNLKLVHLVLSHMYVPKGMYEDYYQEGVAELCRAIRNYDESKGKISTYVMPCIVGAIKKYSASEMSSLQLSRRDQALLRQLNTGISAGKSESELCEELGIDGLKYAELSRSLSSISLDAPIRDADDENVISMISSPETTQDILNDKVINKLLSTDIYDLIDQLQFRGDRQKQAYTEYLMNRVHGIRTTQKHLSEKYGYTRQRLNTLIQYYDKKLHKVLEKYLQNHLY